MKVYLTDEISTVTIDAFFKLPPVVPPIVFKLQKGARIYYYLAGNTWHNFNVHELKKLRQSSDSEFAELLVRLREEKEARQIIEQIRALEDTDTTNWPD